jgi:hypothetical protein
MENREAIFGNGAFLLFVLFLGLKLGNVIQWSWWWVFAPLWIPLLIGFVTLGIFSIVVLLNARRN